MIVYIIGTTAAGKTRLSLNLDADYEIVSCDSMQLYKKADLMTAKATPQEQGKIRHHGLDLLELDEEGFNRAKWREITLKTIKDIQQRNKIPVLVGGTHYYIESIIFEAEENQIRQQIENFELQVAPYDYLVSIDPLAAQKFHRNDERRIINAIKYFKSTGQIPSTQPDYYTDQKVVDHDFLILWPKWKDYSNLKDFVTQRIRDMIDQGGLDEIKQVFQMLDGKQIHGGVLQSIGYRQFERMYEQFKITGTVDQELMEEGVQQLIKDTLKYTKKQIQWIKNRFESHPKISPRLHLFEFDSLASFKDQVLIPANKILKQFIQGNLQLKEPQINEMLIKKARGNWQKHYCEKCKRECNGPYEFEQHLRSRQHNYVPKQKQLKQNVKQDEQVNLINNLYDDEQS